MTADLIALQRLGEMIKAMDKMHNGLLALIDEYQEFKAEANERLDNMRDDVEELRSRINNPEE